MKVEVKKSERRNAPAGFHPARIFQIVDLGTVKNEAFNKSERKLRIAAELPEATFTTEEGEEVTHVVSREFTLKMSKKAHLRKFIEGLLGKGLQDGESFDFEDLAGVACNLNIVHNKSEKNGETYANIDSATPLTKGQKVAKCTRDIVVFDLDNIDDEVLVGLPEWLQDKVIASPEYQEYTGGEFEAKQKAAAKGKVTTKSAPAKVATKTPTKRGK